MPVLSDSELIRFQDWRLRTRPASAQPARLLLMIHGLTGDENSMWVFARDLPAHDWLLAPRAPYAAEPGGYSWRPDPDGDHSRPTLEILRPAVDALIDLVDDYSRSVGIDAQQFDVMGFSQGGAMSNLLAMLYPDRVRKLGVLAGFVPKGVDELVARHPLEGKKVFVAHGSFDTMVPVERARSSIALLEQAGAQVTYCEDEVGHKVSVGCLRSLKSYLQD